MSENQDTHRSESDAELEREIRKDRPFSLSEAIGRLAGPGSMKGASPITRERQVELEIGDYLRLNLPLADCALQRVLLRRVTESELLLHHLDHPLVLLAGYIRQTLGSDGMLKELVRETDVEWGQVCDEHPIFEHEGSPPNPDDPFTIQSVRTSLSGLIEKLNPGST